jgi:RecA-family ATPase
LPVRGITILQRTAFEKPALIETKKEIVMKDIILRNFARRNPALEILDRLHSLVDKAECYTLRYSTLEQAAALLQDAFEMDCP